MDVAAFLEQKAQLINERIEKYLPRKFMKDSLIFKIIPPFYAYNLEALDNAIAAPIWEFLDRGGKRWRPSLFLLIIEAFGEDSAKFLDYSIIPEVVHNGTLMIDDIEDASDLRRGKPSTYRIFGTDIAINAGNAMYYLPLLPLMANAHRLGCEKAWHLYEVYTQEMINLSLGQAMDIAWHRGITSSDQLTERDYLQMCAYKTGTLARMSARMAAILVGSTAELVEKLGHFAESIGIAFQMQDDILDLTSEEFEKKKGARGQDITEGKRSLIVIHTLRSAPKKTAARLTDILNMHTQEQSLRDEAILIMQNCGSIEYVRNIAARIVKQSWAEVKKEIPSARGKERLKAFADFLIERKI